MGSLADRLPYAVAAFIRPTVAQKALRTYRDEFQPSPFNEGLDALHSMLALTSEKSIPFLRRAPEQQARLGAEAADK